MIYSLSSLSSYDDALASALQEGGAPKPAQGQLSSFGTKLASNPLHTNTAPTASTTSAAPNIDDAETADAVSSTFVNSIDVLRRPRRVSPLAPTRGKPAYPAAAPFHDSTRKLHSINTIVNAAGPKGVVPLDTSTGSSVNSVISSVSDVGSALASNAAGARPYQSAPRQVGSEATVSGAATRITATHSTHSGSGAVDERRARTEQEHSGGGGTSTGAITAVVDVTPMPAVADDVTGPANAAAGSIASSVAKPRSRRDGALRVLARWFRLLRWRGKWLSPFAVTLRGQIREGQEMLKDTGGGGISPVSLATQIGVWQSQLLTYMETEPPPGSLKHVLRKRATSGSGGAGTSGPSSLPLEGAASNTSPPSDSRRRPGRMLRRGDGLARRCLSAGSGGTGASSRGSSQAPADAPPTEKAASATGIASSTVPATPDAAAAAGGETKRSASPRQPTSSVSGAAKVPVVTAGSRQAASRIAQFLETITGSDAHDQGGSTRNRGGAAQAPLRVTVDSATLHRRRQQLLETLFQSPDLSSSPNTSRLPSGQPSVVPRLDIHKHREVFCTPGDRGYGAESVFANFWHKPHLLQRYIEEYLDDEPVRGIF